MSSGHETEARNLVAEILQMHPERARQALAVSLLASALATALAVTPLLAQPRPLETREFQVNDSAQWDQLNPRVALAADGTSMFVWETEHPVFLLDLKKVQARLFRASGEPVGDEFRVHEGENVYSFQPAISGDGAGGFVVVWQSQGAAATPGSFAGLLARRFGRGGLPKGDPFAIASIAGTDQYVPAVAAGGGQFAVAWVDCWAGGAEPCPRSAELQRLASDQTPLGGLLELFDPMRRESGIDLASSRSGWILAWGDVDSSLWGLLLDPAGATLGAPIELAELAPRFSVSADAEGNFVVVWLEPTGDPELSLVRARLFDSLGSPRGEPFRIDQPGADAVAGWTTPKVAMDASGDFVAVWESEDDAPYAWASNIQARRFDAQGVPQGSQFRVNVLTFSEQTDPAVASDGIGNFVVAWSSWGSFGDDLDSHSIQARRYSCGLFCDDFERGNTSAWSR